MISEEFSPRGSGAAVSELVLMPVDPYHLHAYWHIGAGDTPDVQKGQQASGKSGLRLRIYCQHEPQSGQSNSEPWFDVAIGMARNWCDVRLPLDNLRCHAALGTQSGDQPFAPLLFSNKVQAPKAGASPTSTAAVAWAENAKTDRQSASPATNRYDERLIDAIIRQALSERDLRVKLNPYADQEEDRERDYGIELTPMALAMSSHTIAHRNIE
jgi:hypothetical protein